MPFSVEGMICSLTAAARLTTVVRQAGAFLQKLPKVTVTWVDPFIYIPSLWIIASEKKLDEQEVYGDLDVESGRARVDEFLKLSGLPGVPPQDVGCTDLGVAAFTSLLTQDPAVYFEIETDGRQVEVEIAAAFEQGRCRFLSTYNAGERALHWLEEGRYKKIDLEPFRLGEVKSGIHESLTYLDGEFARLHNIFQGFLPTRPIGDLRAMDMISYRIETRVPPHPQWGGVFSALKSADL